MLKDSNVYKRRGKGIVMFRISYSHNPYTIKTCLHCTCLNLSWPHNLWTADEKLKDMQRELHKSQQLTKKYQQLLELEKRKLGGVGSGHVTPVSTGDEGESPRVPHPSSYSLLGGNVRVNDIIRKNEVSCFVWVFFTSMLCW